MVQFLSINFFLGFLQFLLGFSKVSVFLCHPVLSSLCVTTLRVVEVQRKVSLVLNKHHSMRTLGINGGEWSAVLPDCFTHTKSRRYQLNKSLGVPGPVWTPWRRISATGENRRSDVPSSSPELYHYTDWAIAAWQICMLQIIRWKECW